MIEIIVRHLVQLGPLLAIWLLAAPTLVASSIIVTKVMRS